MSTEEVPINKTGAAISKVIERTERMEVRQKTTKKHLATLEWHLENSKLKAEFEIEKLQIEVKHLQTQVADLKKGTLPHIKE